MEPDQDPAGPLKCPPPLAQPFALFRTARRHRQTPNCAIIHAHGRGPLRRRVKLYFVQASYLQNQSKSLFQNTIHWKLRKSTVAIGCGLK